MTVELKNPLPLWAWATPLAAGALVDSPVNRDVVLAPEIAEVSTYGEASLSKPVLIPPAAVLQHRAAWVAGWNAKVAR